MATMKWESNDGALFDSKTDAERHDDELLKKDPIYQFISKRLGNRPSDDYEDEYHGYDVEDIFMFIKDNKKELVRLLGEEAGE